MEKHTLITKDDDDLRRLGIVPVISQTEDGKKHVKFTYSHAKKEKAVKEKDHLQLMRYPGDPGTPLQHYYQQLFLTGWTDKRGRYHWPYLLYIGGIIILAIMSYAVAGEIKNVIELLLVLIIWMPAFCIGWLLHWFNEYKERVNAGEISAEGIEDPVIVDPDSEDPDARYATFRSESTSLGIGRFPRDFLFEHVLMVGVIDMKDKRGRPAFLWNSHIFNLAIGPGVKGRKFSNAVLIQGLPTVTIVPRSKQEAHDMMERAIRGKNYSADQVQTGRELIEDIYETLDTLISKKAQFDALLGKELFKINVEDDTIYAYIGALDMQTSQSIKNYQDFIAKGGSLDPKVVAMINEAKRIIEFKEDIPQIQQKFKDKVEMRRMARDRAIMPTVTDLADEKRVAVDRNYLHRVNVGKKALEEKESKSLDEIYEEYLSSESER